MRRLKQNKGMMAKLLVGLVAVFAIMALLERYSHKPLVDTTYHKSGGDTLDIAIELNPTIYGVRGDSVFGRDYEIMQRISSRHGVPVKYHPFVPLSYALEGLERGDFDVVVASLPATAQLKDRFLMSDAVYLDREVLVQLVDSAGGRAINSPLDLAGDTVWIAADSPFATRISNLADEIGDTIYVKSSPEYSAEYLVMLTALGQVRLAVVNESVARAMHPRYPQIDISTPISFTQFQSWAVAKSDSILLDSINYWLAEEKAMKRK